MRTGICISHFRVFLLRTLLESNPKRKYPNKFSGRTGRRRGIIVRETFRTFLQELDGDPNSGKELLQAEVLGIMRREGFTDSQIYEMPLDKLLDLFYEAYLWKANGILSRATFESFLKKLQHILT